MTSPWRGLSKSSRIAAVHVAWLCFASLLSAAGPETARRALDLLLGAQYPQFIQLLNASARDKLTPEFLRDRVGPELKSFGDLREIGSAAAAATGGNTLYSFPVRFSKTSVNVQFLIDAAGKVGGVYLRPQDNPLPAGWKRPAYSKPETFHERAVTIGSDDWKLGGTLTVPAGKGPFPAVVLIHGPGPNDRDESIFSTKIFADLAEGLASRGIAALRYDKRTKIYGPQMSELAYTLREETIDDAVRAIALLRSEPETDRRRVIALGHSLGGFALPRIAKTDGQLAGLIFLAANARRIEDVSISQVEAMVAARGGATPDEQKRIDQMKAEAAEVRTLAPDKPHPEVLMGFPAEYFMDLAGYDAPGAAKGLRLPMLFLQGQRDFQVTMTDFNLWKAALGSAAGVQFRLYPSLNDLFIAGEGASSPTEYRNGGNVASAVIDDISAWVLALKP